MPKFVLESPRPCRNCFFCARTSLARVSFRVFARVSLCMNYVTNMFLLVGWLLCFVQGQGLKREQKHATKNFDEFHNHSPRHKYKCFVNCSFFGCASDGGSPDTTDPYTVAFLDLTLLLGSSFVCSIGQLRDLRRYYLLSHLQLESSPSGF